MGGHGWRLQWRLAAGFVALVVLAMLGLGAYLITSLRAEQFRSLEAQLNRQARYIADEAPHILQTEGPAGLDRFAGRYGDPTEVRVTIVAADGTVLGDSEADPAQMENHANRPEIAQALATGDGEAERHSTTLDRDLLYVAVPIRQDGQTLGVARVALPVDESGAGNRVALAVGAALVVTAVLATILAVLLAGAIARPIQQLTRSARRLAEGDLRQAMPVRASGEVGELAGAFDMMATRVRAHVQVIDDERTRLAAILDHIPDGVLIADGDGRVLLLNPAAARMLPSAADQPLGRRLIELIRDHDLIGLIDEALRGAPEAATAARPIEIGPPGRRVWVHAIATGLPGHGAAGPRALVVLRDVSELRRTEAVRRDFAANVSHELRTPVASLKAMIEALEEGAVDEPPVARDFLARMHVEVDGLIQLIEELLTLARIESGRQTLRLEPIEAGPVVVAAVERLRTQAERHGVELDVDAARSATVRADAERLGQVVVNLVHNAIKFTPPLGRIVVRVEPEDGQVLIRVRDTGEGFSPDEAARLFERFYKTDKSRASGGTGLGLAIAKHLVEAHGGRIWAESAGYGHGSTFTVALPVVMVAQDAPRPT